MPTYLELQKSREERLRRFLPFSELLNAVSALLLFVVAMEEFVVRVFKGGKVTVPKRLRDIFGVEDGDYVRLALVEVLKKEDAGWVRKKVS